jgi:hypothetical protein
MIGSLLRSNEFPRWLTSSALDILVEDASASLAQLSGGQFDLTHEDGEIVVIDHNNADLRRPVKPSLAQKRSKPAWRSPSPYRRKSRRRPQLARHGWTRSFRTKASALWTRRLWRPSPAHWKNSQARVIA